MCGGGGTDFFKCLSSCRLLCLEVGDKSCVPLVFVKFVRHDCVIIACVGLSIAFLVGGFERKRVGRAFKVHLC